LGSGVPIFVNSADQPRRGRAPAGVGLARVLPVKHFTGLADEIIE